MALLLHKLTENIVNEAQKIDNYIKSGSKIASSLLKFYEYVDQIHLLHQDSPTEGHKEVQQITYLTLDRVAQILNTTQLNYLEKLMRDYNRQKFDGEPKYYYRLRDILDCFSLILPHFS